MLDFLKQNLISMIPYIPQNDDNFFDRMLKKFTINFIIFINHFNPRNCLLVKTLTFLKVHETSNVTFTLITYA